MQRRHRVFAVALAAGAVVAAIVPLAPELRVLAGLDAFFAGYVAAMLRLAGRLTAADLRKHAAERDEGPGLILLMAVAAAVGGIGAVLIVLQGAVTAMVAGLALVAVPLGWAMVHMVMALHYAHAFYGAKAAPLAFPGEAAPVMWDFVYFSYGIGMTAQVSDVIVQSAQLRRWVTVHAVGAFFFNTVLLALAVNAGVVLAG